MVSHVVVSYEFFIKLGQRQTRYLSWFSVCIKMFSIADLVTSSETRLAEITLFKWLKNSVSYF